MSIPSNKPFLPPKEEYNNFLKQIWQKSWLTNNGPFVKELEFKLIDYLGVKHLSFVSNGTIALQIAIKALGLKGEIITTPFSYVATTSSIVWEGCKPVFVDIDGLTLNIDANKIEAAITKQTSAILATHVFGNPCEIERIQEIANKYQLKVIYDAAHAFGVSYKEKTIFSYGDISTTSFHATKLFHTVEGGAVICNDEKLKKRIDLMRNFGHDGPSKFTGVGINGKNSEFHAAMGLSNLKYIKDILLKQCRLSLCYDEGLRELKVQRPKIATYCNYNYAYYAILFQTENELITAKKHLEKNQVFARRYFYPVLSSLDYLTNQSMPVAENIANRVLCLPMYYELKQNEVELICQLLKEIQYSY